MIIRSVSLFGLENIGSDEELVRSYYRKLAEKTNQLLGGRVLTSNKTLDYVEIHGTTSLRVLNRKLVITVTPD